MERKTAASKDSNYLVEGKNHFNELKIIGEFVALIAVGANSLSAPKMNFDFPSKLIRPYHLLIIALVMVGASRNAKCLKQDK